ncbi:hypothetical protein C8Q79DRAFT_952190 [Trametes meyenii]|nr:hypothetical protein C8Q79DRAFT_952190 [Trametes meyenii]
MSSRPKPRPRPRPRAPPATATLSTDVPPSSPGPSSAAAGTPPPHAPLATQVLSVEDEDAMFMRNRTRDAQGWKRINKLAEEPEKRKRKKSAPDSSDSEHESGSSPRARGRKPRKRSGKQDTLPDWTRRPEDIIEILSDSDDDIFAPKENKPLVDAESPSKLKGKRPRSRSRSLTPPPALPQFLIDRAQNAINEFMGTVREPSPTDFGNESIDTIVQDPELASIARRVKSQAHRFESSPAPEGGGPENVKLKILWKPHPLATDVRPQVWSFEQKRHDSFHALCADIADMICIRRENLILSYDDKRVFPSSSPHSIGIWAEAELEACDKTTYHYLQENRRMRSESIAPPILPDSKDVSHRSPSRPHSPSATELSDDDGAASSPPSPKQQDDKPSDAFHIKVLSGRTTGEITLLVRPTTKCGAIVRAFLKKAGLEAEYPENPPVPQGRGRGRGKAVAATRIPALSIEGDKMDPETEIGDADLVDGEQVEIVGL